MSIVTIKGIKYKVIYPIKPDPDGWVRLVPLSTLIKVKAK